MKKVIILFGVVLLGIFIYISLDKNKVGETGVLKENKKYENIILEISAKKESHKILVTLHLENISKETVGIPSWYFCKDGVTNDFFLITNEKGEQAEYIGPLIKRKAPTSEEMYFIEPNNSVDITVEISQYYKIPESKYLTIQYYYYPFKKSNCISIQFNS